MYNHMRHEPANPGHPSSDRLVLSEGHAVPILYAACAEGVDGGDFIGPDGLGGSRGHPTKVKASARAYDAEAQARLWDVSEAATGVRYTPLA